MNDCGQRFPNATNHPRWAPPLHKVLQAYGPRRGGRGSADGRREARARASVRGRGRGARGLPSLARPTAAQACRRTRDIGLEATRRELLLRRLPRRDLGRPELRRRLLFRSSAKGSSTSAALPRARARGVLCMMFVLAPFASSAVADAGCRTARAAFRGRRARHSTRPKWTSAS